ncbi:AI-2E family transporter [Temperatibacter marinus]|uniref:AI-2E family transporter n=1 Tax=Temperatibacter marinus TaxID=1456591 RepID=A0AA52EFI6_9PROT|nr:AI-2E family transporter [Temperatibacter marinus]WND02178.1 AI-2E family transporter [Temperatibacter marinus]
MNKWVLAGICIFISMIVYVSKAVLLPFLAGLAIAYFLDPLADKLEERKLPRGGAAAIVLLVFFLALGGVVFAFWPIIKAQLASVSTILPKTISSLGPWFDELTKSLHTNFGIDINQNAESVIASAADKALGSLNQAISSILRNGAAVLNLLMLLLISPVVAFYLLRDWDLIVARVNGLLPPKKAADIRSIMINIDKALAGFVRGQMIVAMIMGVLYAVGWSLAGLNFSVLLGVLAGVLAFIPFVGAIFAALLATLVAVGQFGFDGGAIGLVLLVYAVVQIVEGAFLTPKLVGDKVGLHPVWVLFAIFAGSEAMGFVGVLISVPFAAAIAVLARFWIKEYETHYDLGTQAPVESTTTSNQEEIESHKA